MSIARVMLIGLRAGGKSTVAGLLATRLRATMIDLDDRTAAKLGSRAAGDAIKRYGLAAFRRAELAALDDVLCGNGPTVLALGGGTPTAPGADVVIRAAKGQGWRVVYLHADVQALQDRLSRTDLSSRPPLLASGTAPSPAQSVIDEVGTVYLQRDGLYRALADVIVETGLLEPEAITAHIAAWLKPAESQA